MFNKSEEAIKSIAKSMSLIHEKYEGKENKELRESLLQPLRDACVDLHKFRIDLNVLCFNK